LMMESGLRHLTQGTRRRLDDPMDQLTRQQSIS
jgi:hypothetical protein